MRPDEYPHLRACLEETRALRAARRTSGPASRRSRLAAVAMVAGALLVATALPPTVQGLLAAPAAASSSGRVAGPFEGWSGWGHVSTGAEGMPSGLRPVAAQGRPAPQARRPAAAVAMSTPVRVSVPAVGVRADVVRMGRRADGSMGAPRRPEQAAWYRHGPVPGAPGAALLIGHVDSPDGPAAFHGLRAVAHGDRIAVTDRHGRVAHFVVHRVTEHPKDDFPTREVFGGVTRPELRLVTCSGSFNRLTRHYSHNLVVHAHLVPEPSGGGA